MQTFEKIRNKKYFFSILISFFIYKIVSSRWRRFNGKKLPFEEKLEKKIEKEKYGLKKKKIVAKMGGQRGKTSRGSSGTPSAEGVRGKLQIWGGGGESWKGLHFCKM